MKFQIIIAILTFTYSSIQACSCEILNSFINGISGSETVARVQILEHEELPVDYIREELLRINYPELYKKMTLGEVPPLPPYLVSYYGFTKLLVEEIYLGEMRVDTIGFYNGDGGMCYSSLGRLPVGTRLILKMSNEDNKYDLVDNLKLLHPFIFKYPMYASSICSIWELRVEGDTVIGSIDSNKKFDLLYKANNEEGLSKSERDKIIKQIQAIDYERFSLEKFKAMFNKKLSVLKN